MRPLAAVVLGLYRQTLTIELESGVILEIPERYDLLVGDKCWVAYDYTNNEVRQVYRNDPWLETKQENTEEVEGVLHVIDNNIDPEDLELLLQED